jgi:hypothetical protein
MSPTAVQPTDSAVPRPSGLHTCHGEGVTNDVKALMYWLAGGLMIGGLLMGLVLPVTGISGADCGSAFIDGGGLGDACGYPRGQAVQMPVAMLVIGFTLMCAGLTASTRPGDFAAVPIGPRDPESAEQ